MGLVPRQKYSLGRELFAGVPHPIFKKRSGCSRRAKFPGLNPARRDSSASIRRGLRIKCS